MALRTPVESAAPQRAALRIIGVDPGFAHTGVAVLEDTGQGIEARHVSVLKTEKQSEKKGVVALRKSVDDVRRFKEVHDGLCALIDLWKPRVLCLETYVPFGNRGMGWKTAKVEGIVQAVGMHHNLMVLAFLPLDLKRAFGLTKSASKLEIGNALQAKVPSLERLLASIPQTKHEHATDAAGHAYLGFAHLVELRQSLGDL